MAKDSTARVGAQTCGRPMRPTAVIGIEDRNSTRVGEALEILVKLNREGRLPSLMFIAESPARSEPMYGMVGRFRGDPVRAIGALSVMREKVTEYAAGEDMAGLGG